MPWSSNINMDKDSKRKHIIVAANDVLEVYGRMTVRAIFYQLVTRGVITNTLKEYSRVVQVLTDARRAGLIDWRRISDHTTKYYGLSNRWGSLTDFLDDVKDSFHLYPDYGKIVEVWIEKDAMSWVSEVSGDYNLPTVCMVGYAKLTALEKLKSRLSESGKDAVVFLLTDYDPSGRNIAEKVAEELAQLGNGVRTERLVLTGEQCSKYNLPSVPAKPSDPRTKAGDVQVELDALPPDVMRNILVGAIRGVITDKEIKSMRKAEQDILERLDDIVSDAKERSQ